jgi:ABC-type nitrate/sulfonate/bicarbonate transport system permease component
LKSAVLIGLMALFIAGNLIGAVTTSYTLLLISRVIAGLTQGRIYGIGAVVATKLVSDRLAGQAVEQMFAGLTLTNVLGVSAGRWIGNALSWNMTFLVISALGLIASLIVAGFVAPFKWPFLAAALVFGVTSRHVLLEHSNWLKMDNIGAARLLGASEWQITKTVIIPSTMAWLFASLAPAIAFSLIGVIVGEFIGAQRGIGRMIIEAEARGEASGMMVAVFVLMISGVLLTTIMQRVQGHLLRWQPQHQEAS